jgi:hypothetical protein
MFCRILGTSPIEAIAAMSSAISVTLKPTSRNGATMLGLYVEGNTQRSVLEDRLGATTRL